MIIEQIKLNNPYQHYNYIIVCPETLEALVIDPYDAHHSLEICANNGWKIRQILNTHAHGDHTQGNAILLAKTGADLLAHYQAQIEGVTHPLHANMIVRVGTTVEMMVLDTPGHTLSHICLYGENNDPPVLFCGDTLFNAGCGNCLHGGDADLLYDTFDQQLGILPEITRVYPGHDYWDTNLAFAASLEPANPYIKEWTAKIDPIVFEYEYATTLLQHVTTLHDEKLINPFFRLESPDIEKALRAQNPTLPEKLTRKDIFLLLRKLRNSFA